MTINLKIQADIIDIRTDVPQENDIFLVDTNVWLWYAYPNTLASARSSSEKRSTERKIKLYTGYLNQAIVNGAKLKYSGLILAELAHVIEKTECEIYNRKNKTNLDLKKYRHNYPNERSAIVGTIQFAWSQITMIATSADSVVDQRTTDAVIHRSWSQALDGYDLLILEAISRAGLKQVKVITADMDYAVVPEIQVFTSHGSVIQQAQAQGKLLTRN